MRIRKLSVAVLFALATIAFVPSAASAQCYDNTGMGVVDDKVLYDTCTGCGYVMVRGKYIPLFPCV
jgi:hypothetical protein